MNESNAQQEALGGHAENALGLCTLIIFGATGDLTKRLLVPAQLNLHFEGKLSPNFSVVAVGRKTLTNMAFCKSLIDENRSDQNNRDSDGRRWIEENFTCLEGSFEEPETYSKLKNVFVDRDRSIACTGTLTMVAAQCFAVQCRQLVGTAPGVSWQSQKRRTFANTLVEIL